MTRGAHGRLAPSLRPAAAAAAARGGGPAAFGAPRRAHRRCLQRSSSKRRSLDAAAARQSAQLLGSHCRRGPDGLASDGGAPSRRGSNTGTSGSAQQGAAGGRARRAAGSAGATAAAAGGRLAFGARALCRAPLLRPSVSWIAGMQHGLGSRWAACARHNRPTAAPITAAACLPAACPPTCRAWWRCGACGARPRARSAWT